MSIARIIEDQRRFHASGATRPLAFRLAALERLRSAILAREDRINAALFSDLHKAPAESYMTETGLVLEEIGHQLRHLPRWVRDRRVATPLAHFPSRSFVSPEPYGVTLVMAPWNYPLQLSLVPLIGAVGAGNTVVLKPSAYAPATSAVLADLVAEVFAPEHVSVVEGGRAENQALLEQRFDYIFFTGSVEVGKLVMRAASDHLTPLTLELGGKSPVIVDETADLALAARRIAFGKVINAGQTCVAPDYLLIQRSVRDRFVAEFAAAIDRFFPGRDFDDFPRIVTDKHFQRLTGLMEGQQIALGGDVDADTRFIEPTLLTGVALDAPVMAEEIFGPILPVIDVADVGEAIEIVRARPKPLAFYLFTSSKAVQRRVFDACSFGGGCLNDTLVHIANPRMGFGGVGESGMGSYHGKHSFDTFSHHRSIVAKATWLDIGVRYHPYTPAKAGVIRQLLK